MNKLKFKYAIGLIAAAFIMVANLQYAFSEYGIPFASTLHINVLAQTSNGSGNSSTGGGTGSGGTSSGSATSSSGNGNNTGNGNTKCPDHNYVPNRAIAAVESTSTVTSNANGEITINGVLKIGYGKNKSYPIVVETKNCSDPADGSCCDQREVGVKVISY